jgi:hypothetical protein
LIKKVDLTGSKNSKKYGWKEIEVKNNFPHRNLSIFEMELESKFEGVPMS